MLAAHPDRIDNAILSHSKGFSDWHTRSTGSKTGPAGDVDDLHGSTAQAERAQGLTPQERIERAASEINDALTSEVLEAVLGLTPARFERLVVDLLIAMEYGGGDTERGLHTSLSGDRGIDGIINEDELGLDAVYVQAKRYAPDNKVGRPALNAFVGSLTGEGASKGVFVTTSDYSREAREYVSRVQHRIVLINGDRLARLMIQHGVGVRARRTIVVRSVDEDYFSEN